VHTATIWTFTANYGNDVKHIFRQNFFKNFISHLRSIKIDVASQIFSLVAVVGIPSLDVAPNFVEDVAIYD
jgi:hypothetical protein